jgi:hypothetical protein
MSTYSIGGAIIRRMTLTQSWGLQPASATIEAVGAGLFQPGSGVTLSIGASVFHGRIGNCVERFGDDGRFLSITAVDNRILLMNDVVFGSFNEVEILEDNPATPGIDRMKRYVHVYPEHWQQQQKTRTTQPLKASEILRKLFAADTVKHGWSFLSHPRLQGPVYGVDATRGKKLGTVVQEVLEQLGLMMTLTGPATLGFAVKGEGQVPTLGPVNSKNLSAGAALGPETKVCIVGDRNVYQDLPIELEPDWNRAFEAFWYEPAWIAEVRSRFSLSSAGAAKAKALEVTLREYCAVAGKSKEDRGKWGEVSRMEIPVWVYLNDIVFKAYRVPRKYRLRGMDLDSLELRDGLLAPVESTTSGELSYKTDDYYPDTKAYCIAQGQQLNRFDPKFLDAVTVEDLAGARTRWHPVNKFNLDTKNKVIIFEEPVFVDGAGDGALFVAPNANKSGLSADLQKLVVPNARARISPAAVRASLCFEAEMFSKWYGSGTRANSVYVPNLNYHALMRDRAWSREIRYVSGRGADQIASDAGASALTGQNFLQSGGFTRVGAAGMTLNGTIDRITVLLQFEGGGDGDGITEQIDYAKERAPVHFEAERELERRAKVPDALKQLREQRDMSAQVRFIAKHLKPQKRQTERRYQGLSGVMQTPIGAVHGGTQTFASDDWWLAGQPVFVLPNGVPDPNGTIFRGIVIANMATGPAIATATQGVVPVRAKGPWKAGDKCGINKGSGQVPSKKGKMSIGTFNCDYAGTDIVLAPVRLGSAAIEVPEYSFQLLDGTDENGPKVLVVDGKIKGEYPAGMDFSGDLEKENDFLLSIGGGFSGNRYDVYAEVKYNTETFEITSRTIKGVAPTDVPESEFGTLIVKIGYATLARDADGKIATVAPHNTHCGDIEFTFDFGGLNGLPALKCTPFGDWIELPIEP